VATRVSTPGCYGSFSKAVVFLMSRLDLVTPHLSSSTRLLSLPEIPIASPAARFYNTVIDSHCTVLWCLVAV